MRRRGATSVAFRRSAARSLGRAESGRAGIPDNWSSVQGIRSESTWSAFLAAGILLAVGIAGWLGLNWNHRFQVNHGLQTAVISHIQDELDHLHADHNIKPGAVAYLLSQFGAAVKGDVGRVNFISRCDIRRQSGVHMVVPGRQGPVTVLIMPGEHRMEREQIRSSRYTGVIIPTDYGSMAVVGERLEPVEQIAEKMQQTIVWDA